MHEDEDVALDNHAGEHQHEREKADVALYGDLEVVGQYADKNTHETGSERPFDTFDVVGLFLQLGFLLLGKCRLFRCLFLHFAVDFVSHPVHLVVLFFSAQAICILV